MGIESLVPLRTPWSERHTRPGEFMEQFMQIASFLATLLFILQWLRTAERDIK